jgi:hypothetical protein
MSSIITEFKLKCSSKNIQTKMNLKYNIFKLTVQTVKIIKRNANFPFIFQSISYRTSYSLCVTLNFKVVLQLKWLVSYLCLRRPEFSSRTINAEFVVGELALTQVSLQVLRFVPCQYHSTAAHIHSPIIWVINNVSATCCSSAETVSSHHCRLHAMVCWSALASGTPN